jgi:type II secretory pathway pseudopilin PulG
MGRKGSLLIEAVAAMGILAVGLVMVMQTFATQRRGVSYNGDATQALLALQSRLGAVYAGIKPHELSAADRKVAQHISDAPLKVGGLKQVDLTAPVGGTSARTLDVTVYIRSDQNKGL